MLMCDACSLAQTLCFVIEAYPVRPDSLSLANSVALKLGRAAEGCPKAAELLKVASAEEERLSAQRKVIVSSTECPQTRRPPRVHCYLTERPCQAAAPAKEELLSA